MAMTRRGALKATATTTALLVTGKAMRADATGTSEPPREVGRARWICYPGQLAAWRHLRRLKLAVERCVHIGYPANFRQPATQAWFRRTGVAERDTPLRWSVPIGRTRVTVGGRGGAITERTQVMRRGDADIVAQVDFAQSLPAILLEGQGFSTGAGWEASLDGETWIAAEVIDEGDPGRLPDAERDIVTALPVARVVEPASPRADRYALKAGRDLILDFNDTELGALHFEAEGRGVLTIQVGESVTEVRDPDPAWFEQYPLAPIALGEAQAIALPERALRFVRIAASDRATISRVRFEAKRHPAEARGRFVSNDPELNAIWTVAVATLRSNMHDFYLDGIRRDGLIWHDGPLTLPAYERVFFERDLSRQSLVAETLPPHPRVADIGILDSPMYAVIGFDQEYMAQGDIGFARLFRDRIEDILGFLAGLQGRRGFVDARDIQPYGFFPDWSATPETGPDPHGTPAYAQMLLAGAFAAGSRLARAWGHHAAARRHAEAADRLRAAIRSAFRRPDGLYHNGFDPSGALDRRLTSFAQAFAIEFDIAGPEDYPALIAFLNDTRRRPAHYSLSQVIELGAYAKAGRAADAVARLRIAWLPLIQQGYRRFFEDIVAGKPADAQLAMYGRRYGASLCHAWAGAAPVLALSRGVLGVEPLAPGYARCRIAPQPCGLRQLEGAVPTPHGDIVVGWQGDRGMATVPAGITAVIGDRQVSGPGNFTIPRIA